MEPCTGYTAYADGSLTTYSVSELGHFDGSTWNVYSLGDLELFPGPARVWSAAPGDVWMVFKGSKIYHLQMPGS